MPRLGDIATLQVAGMPDGDGVLRDAWLIWRRIRNSVTDRNRGLEERNEELAVKPLAIDGVPGWVWLGHLSDARRFVFPGGQPREHPYTSATNDAGDMEAAKRNFSPVHTRLTKSSGNLVCIEKHRLNPSIWWVRDEFNEFTMSEPAYRRLQALAKGGEPPAEPAAAARVPAVAPPKAPAPAQGTILYICRYRDAAGCDFTTRYQGTLYQHSEAGSPHSVHEVVLNVCPVCGDGFDTAGGRALHLSKTHDVTKDSELRNTLDRDQTTELWKRRGAKAEAKAAEAGGMSPGTVYDTADPDIEAALNAHVRTPAVSEPAPEPAPAQAPAEPARSEPALSGGRPRNAAVEAVRMLVDDYDRAVAERDAAVAERDRLRKVRADLSTALQLTQEALNDLG